MGVPRLYFLYAFPVFLFAADFTPFKSQSLVKDETLFSESRTGSYARETLKTKFEAYTS